MQTLKNKAFHVSVRWDTLVRKPLALERGGFTKRNDRQLQTSLECWNCS